MQFCYQYPHPAVTTDIVIFTIQNQQLDVLLVRRRNEPFKDQWALPGGFVDIDEDLEACAKRELYEETNLSNVYLEQLYTFGQHDRDPRERIITVAYYALIPMDKLKPKAGSDASEVNWFSVNRLPTLGFDHDLIINKALKRVAAKTRYSTIALQFLANEFTLPELQEVYQILRNESLDKRNFRKWILSLDCLEETGEVRRNGQHRPAKLYRAKHPDIVEIFK
jgi:8-oxo-dGTP diphosphatase